MYDLIAQPLSFFYSVWPSYAGSIVLLTLSIMVVLTPLTLKGTRSMLAMQRLQPELKRLQAKYKDDRQKLNEEMLKFYKENGINPVSGCLPLLLQMPVFFFLYRTLIGLTARGPYGADMGSQVAATTGGGVYENFGVFHPQHLDKSSDLYQALTNTREMTSWGLNLADSATGALNDGVGHAAPYILLVLLVAGTSYVQQKQVSGRSPQSAQINPQQQMLLRLMPAFFAFISLGLPAGVVLYFFVSNLYRIGQQAFITRTMYADGGILSTTATEVDPSPKSKGSDAAPERRGILGALGLGSGSVPTTGRASTKGKDPAKNAQRGSKGSSKAKPAAQPAKPSRRPARGASARPVAQKRGEQKPESAGRQSGADARRPPGKGPSGRNGSANGKSGGPSRQPPAPVNRSRTKKKRK